jgi:glycosyltransferase involved in cell wall biosynthesis
MNTYKIAYIFTPIEFGGAERVNITFLRHVDRTVYHIEPVLLIRPWETDNQILQEITKQNYTVYKVPVALKPRSKGRDYFRLLRCYWMIHAFLKKGAFDLVHTHGYFADLMGIPAARLLGIPHISTCHGFISNDVHLKLYNWLDRIALRFSGKIIAVSDDIRRDLIGRGIRPSRVMTLQNAVDGNISEDLFLQHRNEKRKYLRITDGDFAVGYVGRLSEEKGVKYLLRACSLLRRSGVAVRVLLIGEGTQRQELEILARDEDLEDVTYFAGFRRDVESWLPAFDVVVLPSLNEGTPMSVLEAMALGVPVVATAVGGIPQMIDNGRNGILVPPGDTEKILEALCLLHADDAKRKELSLCAKQTIRNKYDVSDWVRKLEAEYQSLVNKKRAGLSHQ